MTTRTNLVLDIGLTGAFLAISNPPLTGLAVHEWLGLTLAVGMLVHVVFHWNWVAGISGRLFGRLRPGARLDYLVDVVLFVTFIAAVLSGLLTSKHVLPLFGVAAFGRAWRGIHELTANVAVVAVAVHVGLHWRAVAPQLKRLFSRTDARRQQADGPLRRRAPA